MSMHRSFRSSASRKR